MGLPRRWAKLNAFLAQLTQTAPVHYAAPGEELYLDRPDGSMRDVWLMAMTLEYGHPPETLVETAAIQSVCWWFIYAADRMWENVRHARAYPEEGGATPGEKYKKEGWTGYTRERWQTWVQVLEEAQSACTDSQVGELIRNALVQVRRVMAA